ncbi:MAG: ABC-type transporter, integral rane subunit [Gemmatimonadetes bacterium]|nr:ABC-type transporter, integral rane subunit [Gemmatimonadota bacterium]
MRASLLRRVIDAIVLFWLVVTLTFVLVRLAPGDPAELLIAPSASASERAQLRASLGLDASLATQYARWGGALLRGDMGESVALHRPVSAVLAEAVPVSLGLGVASLALTFLLGVPIGLAQALRRGRATDRLLTVLTTTVYAAPAFWLALALVAVFTYGAASWGLPPWMRLPAFGLHAPGGSPGGLAGFRDLLRHAVLPVTILAALGAAGIARYARSSFAALLGEDWIRTARAKGAREHDVRWHHLLRPAMPPLVILFALALPGVIAGSIFVESIFAWPGMGRVMVSAISTRDYPVVLGATLLYAALVIAANLASDLAMPLLDPRRRGAA